jgi:cell division protein FtsA
MHVVHGRTNRFQNAIRLVKGMHLEVEDIVFNGLASALAILTAEQKELGSLVIDLGAGVTEYVVYARGVVKHTGVLAVGGDHVSQDLALGLKVPQGRAEKLKLEHGDAIFDETARGLTFTPGNELGLPERPINIEHLRCVMSLRLQETFAIIREELDDAGWPISSGRASSSVAAGRASRASSNWRSACSSCPPSRAMPAPSAAWRRPSINRNSPRRSGW